MAPNIIRKGDVISKNNNTITWSKHKKTTFTLTHTIGCQIEAGSSASLQPPPPSVSGNQIVNLQMHFYEKRRLYCASFSSGKEYYE